MKKRKGTTERNRANHGSVHCPRANAVIESEKDRNVKSFERTDEEVREIS